MPKKTKRDYETKIRPLESKDELRTHEDLLTPFMSTQRVWITQALFWESAISHKDYCLFTLTNEDFVAPDGRVIYSFHKLYMQESDPTEYQVANKWLGGYPHWQRITKNKMIAPYIALYREELEVKLRSDGMKSIIGSAANGNYNAAKFLADKGWEKKRGRPSKEEVQGEMKKEAMIKSELDADAARIGLVRVK